MRAKASLIRAGDSRTPWATACSAYTWPTGCAVSISVPVASKSTARSRTPRSLLPDGCARARSAFEREPEPQQVALAARSVLVRGARVDDRVIRDQLQVAGRELHAETQLGRRSERLVEIEQLELELREWRHVGVSHRGAEVVAVPERRELAFRVTARRHREPAARAVSLLVARVEPERLVEPRRELGALREDRVVDRDAARDPAGAALARAAQTQEPDHVGEVAVRADLAARAIAAHVRIRRLLVHVDDV